MTGSSQDYGVAFGLVLIAGLCAPLGASIVLFMNQTKSHMLAAAIALAGGVMIFVSLTEVLGDSISDLEAGGLSTTVSQLVGFICFFCGIALCYTLDFITDSIVKGASRGDSNLEGLPAVDKANVNGLTTQFEAQDVAVRNTTCKAPQSVIDYATNQIQRNDQHVLALMRTSILVGVALSLHNFPEGLATFVAYMADAKLGITIAISIAMHNIPEGIAIGVPVYYATGSKLKAIGWTALSGLAEPVGALIGLAIHLSGELNMIAIGITMALVAGIMTGVAIRELIPRSIQYDESNNWSSAGVFVGMGIMALSIVMLSAWG